MKHITENLCCVKDSNKVIMSLSDKPNPNNPIVFFDVSVGSTVSRVN